MTNIKDKSNVHTILLLPLLVSPTCWPMENKESKMLADGNDLAIDPSAASSGGPTGVILMNRTKLNASDGYKQCAGKGCKNQGKIVLGVQYLNQTGHFCKPCAEDLLQNDLAAEVDSNV